jgi:hypothetical protein
MLTHSQLFPPHLLSNICGCSMLAPVGISPAAHWCCLVPISKAVLQHSLVPRWSPTSW